MTNTNMEKQQGPKFGDRAPAARSVNIHIGVLIDDTSR